MNYIQLLGNSRKKSIELQKIKHLEMRRQVGIKKILESKSMN